MRVSTAARLTLGAAFLVVGFGVLTDGSPTRGPLAQSIAGWFDMKERQCRNAQVAAGSSCPSGCEARPASSVEVRTAPPECHSRLWIATCGKACAPDAGFARLPEGGLADDGRLIVTLSGEPDEAFRRELSALGVTLTARFDGLDRYDAVFREAKVEEIKKRLSALPLVVSAEYVLR